MNVVQAGSNFQIYGEDIKSYDKLPVGTYEISFHKMMGFFLTSHSDLLVKEDKVYGNSEEKVDKILRSFSATDRNFGVILSGPKGVGKSLFARILAKKAAANNLPLLICSQFVPGLPSFISSIEQEVIVLFDEFEKTFADTEEVKPQEEMLSLFDGVDSGKKLFVITCNELRQLNNYLLNRPGRFHYHFTLGNPNPSEIEEYMRDKLSPQYHFYIPQIVNFSLGGNLTYDCLRAIAFEINNGYSLEETVQDLNISREKIIYFDIHIEWMDGGFSVARKVDVDFYRDVCREWVYGDPATFRLDFHSSDIKYDPDRTIYSLDASKVSINYDEDDLEDMPEEKRDFIKNRKVKSVTLFKCKDDFVYKYAV